MKKINGYEPVHPQQLKKKLKAARLAVVFTAAHHHLVYLCSKIKAYLIDLKSLMSLFFLFLSMYHIAGQAQAPANAIQPAVWANEAIIATYTFDHAHFIEQEKALAKYFTSAGWIDYSQAMQASNLPQQIKANAYVVTAVATLPPTLKSMPNGSWEATMPILVLYKNPAYSQKQDLSVVLKFVESTTQGVRGFAIQSLKSTVITPPCQCAKKNQGATIV